MQTIESLRQRIAGVEDLQTVVRTMKSLAAVNIRQYEKAVESLSAYYQTIELGLYVVLKDEFPEALASPSLPEGGLSAVVMGSDQGLCGRFNDQIASHALETLNGLEPRPELRQVLCVGGRAQAHLEEAGQPVEAGFSLPGSLSGITPAVQTVLMKLEEIQSRRGLDRILLFYNKSLPGASYLPQTLYLLPLDQAWLGNLTRKPWPSRVLPVYTMDRTRLFDSLVRQYLFVSLYRAFAESMASENASRLASMQVAERNIGERLEELHAESRHRRQTSITEELLDIVAGLEALVTEPKL